jgi:hypothetical protein
MHPKHLAVEEQQGRKRLLVGRSRDMSRIGEVGKELLNLVPTHHCRVTKIVETYEGADPFDIGLLGP